MSQFYIKKIKQQYGQSDLIWMKTNEGHIFQVRAMRISYVGELGYELHIKSSGKGITSIFETLYSAENVSLAGFEALNSMSLEKGHRQEQNIYRNGIDSTQSKSEKKISAMI